MVLHLLLFPALTLVDCSPSWLQTPLSSRRLGGSGEGSAASACGVKGCCAAGPVPEGAVRQ